MRIPVIFFFTALLFLPGLVSALPAAKKNKITEKQELSKYEPKTKDEILESIRRPDIKEKGSLEKILNLLTINSGYGPLIPFPYADSNRDMGISYGVMPVLAVKNGKTGEYHTVVVPSFSWNRYLGFTASYRHYIFPDEKRYMIFRGSLSQHVERELMGYYYEPDFFGDGIRFSFEPRYWVSGKPSYYGSGRNSTVEKRANYALSKTGEETTLEFPLSHSFYFNFTNSLYLDKVVDGPVSSGNLAEYYPEENEAGRKDSLFHINKLSLVFDDTDHMFLPTIGTYASASVAYSNKALGADYEYRTYAFQVKNYYNYKEQGIFVTAFHSLLEFQRGEEIPFYARVTMGESTGMRSVGDGRFTDSGKLIFSLEERIRLTHTPFMQFVSELEIGPFIDAGTVFSKPSEMRMKDFMFSPGFSMRLVIRPQLVGSVEFAAGPEGSNTVLRVGYPF